MASAGASLICAFLDSIQREMFLFCRAGDESRLRNPYRWLPRKDDRDDKKDKKKGAERRTSSPSEVMAKVIFFYKQMSFVAVFAFVNHSV